MTQDSFKSAGHDWRLFCGPDAIENNLKAAVTRAGAKRAMVVCSPSIQSKTNLIARIGDSLGDLYAGAFDGIEKDSSYASVRAATEKAQDLAADLLIAVGGGSVIVATRAVSIFLSEAGDPFDLMTQYPEGGKPFSPRLTAPKVPIINIPTTPTSAMNRAGTGLKNPDLDHRMEFFDPKTRPQAIFIDDGALLSAPDGLIRSTATTVFAWAAGATSLPPRNPLADGDQAQAFKLAYHAYLHLPENMGNAGLRRDLCLAAFLQNRSEDDGQPLFIRGPFAGDYAVATALHLQYPSLKQGEATAVVHAASVCLARDVSPAQARQSAEALGVWQDGMDSAAATDAVAADLERVYKLNGMPTQLRDLNISKEDFPEIAGRTVKIFNASADLTSPEDRIARSLELLESAWSDA
ncbi:MAG: iron-containing alcohol dehydrogenase [Rhodospirillales bacterium]